MLLLRQRNMSLNIHLGPVLNAWAYLFLGLFALLVEREYLRV